MDVKQAYFVIVVMLIFESYSRYLMMIEVVMVPL